MPIEVATQIQVFDQEQFHALDKKVMAIVFGVHNKFGRLLDESIYKCAIAEECAKCGIHPVEREVRIRVTHKSFCKDFSMDLLFGQGMMLEAKTAEAIMPVHRAQSLNYLLLTGMKHGKLVNLRPERVEYEFVSTNLDAAKRRRFTVLDSDWREPNAASTAFKRKFVELLDDWGAFLEIGLYREAIIQILGGPSSATREIEIWDGSRSLGRQRCVLLSGDTAMRCTAINQGIEQMGNHLGRLLAHTKLRYIQWANLNHAQIEFRTLSIG